MSIGRSTALLFAQRFLSQHAQSFAQASERLSSGLRINRASDDAAGLAISSRLRSDARVFNQAMRNGNDAISALSIAEGSASQLSGVVTRLKELATQASNGSFSRTQRISLDEEAEALVLEFNRIVSTTEFNKLQLFSADLSRMRIQLGYGVDGSIDFGLGSELRRNIGDGFGSNTIFQSGTSSQSHQALGDVNGDGILDMVTGDGGSMPNFNLSIGNGDGTFQASTSIAASGNTNKVVLADVNGDGRLDLLGSSTGATMDVYLNQGGNTPFSSYTTYTTSGSANRAIEVADINGDGWVDLVTAGNSSAAASVLLGTGGGNFGTSTAYTFSTTLKDMRLRDFNGDGILDIGAVSNSGLHIMTGSAAGTFGLEQLTSVALTSARMDAADVNNDGIYDIVATNGASGAVVYHGRTDGTFTLAASLDPSAGAAAITDAKFADIDGDGILDVFTGASDNLTFFKGKADGTYEEHEAYAGSWSAGFISIEDLNADGVVDLVVPYSIAGRVAIRLATTEESATIQQFNLATRETALEALDALEARARIEDADVAIESAKLIRSRILQDAAAAMISHASMSGEFLLDLLKS